MAKNSKVLSAKIVYPSWRICSLACALRITARIAFGQEVTYAILIRYFLPIPDQTVGN